MLHGLNVFTAPPTQSLPRSLAANLLAYLHEGYDAWLAIYGSACDLSDYHPDGNIQKSCGQLTERISPPVPNTAD